MSENDVYVAGIPCWTARDSTQVTYEGGVTVMQETATGRTLGQRQTSAVTALRMSVQPKVDADDVLLRAVLNQSGIIPVMLFDGTTYAVQSDTGANTVNGYIEQATSTYEASWQVRRDVGMADTFLRSGFGIGAYSGSYTQLGSRTLVNNAGYDLVGTGGWGHTWVREVPVTTVARPQPQLVVEWMPSGTNCEGAVGLRYAGAMPSSSTFGSNGLGVYWTSTALAILGDNDLPVASVTRTVAGTRYTAVITARPWHARVELWAGRTRLLRSVHVPWTMPPIGQPMAAVINVRTATARLYRWWVVKG